MSADPTPYTPTDEDMEDRYVRHSLALMDFPRGDRDEWEQKLRIEFRRGLARVRASALRDAATKVWSCGVARSGYHNGSGCTPRDRHEFWGCEYRYEFSIPAASIEQETQP